MIGVFGIGARQSRIVYKDRTINVRARRIEEPPPMTETPTSNTP